MSKCQLKSSSKKSYIFSSLFWPPPLACLTKCSLAFSVCPLHCKSQWDLFKLLEWVGKICTSTLLCSFTDLLLLFKPWRVIKTYHETYSSSPSKYNCHHLVTLIFIPERHNYFFCRTIFWISLFPRFLDAIDFNSMGKNIIQNILCVPVKNQGCHFCVKFHAKSLKAHIYFDMDWTCNPFVRYDKNTQWWTLYEQQN